ncbi:MAG: biosynthetic-type acetolactate synthase large subunit [Chloroflexota bacterium]|nr:biosynthetic-type acetolactate synthase large subunit [Chloroflexota bacterium]
MATAIASDPATRPAELRGADLVCVALERSGVDVVFGYPGGACLPIYDALPDHPSLRHVLVRHEQGAAHMADGYARVAGRPGVCLVTSGPGATNLVTGLACAYMDSVPVVAITGQVATSLMGRDAFQETDVLGMVGPVTKHAFLPRTVGEIVPTIERAMHVARSGRPGPVVVDIPKDAQNASAALPDPIVPIDTRSALPEREIEEAAALLERAERPLIIAGHGVRLARAHEALRDLAERLDAPVAMTLLGISGFPEDHELALGMLGMHGSAITNRAVNAADVILGVGLRFDDRVTGKIAAFAPHARIIHVDIDATQIEKNVPTAVGIVADAREALRAIAVRVGRRSHPEWRKQVFSHPKAQPRLEAFEASVELAPRPVIHAIREAAADDAYFVADVGQHQMWAAQHLRFTHPDRFLTSGGLGTMGYGLPAALGAQYARRDAQVWAIVGDGGVQMTLQELGTAVQEDLPVKVVVMNNGYLGMVRQWQQLFYDGRISQTPITSPDYVKIAEAYGVQGTVVEHRNELGSALARAATHNGPALIDVRIERHANVWPIVPPGGANADLIEEPTA